MRIGGRCTSKEFGVILEMVADAPAITRYHPRYHLRMRYHLKYPRSGPPQKLNKPSWKKKKKWFQRNLKRGAGRSMRGQNWKVSVEIYRSFLYLRLSQICPSLAQVVSIKRISTLRRQSMSIMIDTGWNFSLEPSNKDSFKILGRRQKLFCQQQLSKVVKLKCKTLIYDIIIWYCGSHNKGGFPQNIVAPALSVLIVSDERIQLAPFQNNYIQQSLNVRHQLCVSQDHFYSLFSISHLIHMCV